MLCQFGLVNVRSLLFVPADEPFFGHDLKSFENGCIAGWFVLVEGFLYFAHGARAALPEDPKDAQLSIGRTWRPTCRHIISSREFIGRLSLQVLLGAHTTTKAFVVSTKIFVLG